MLNEHDIQAISDQAIGRVKHIEMVTPAIFAQIFREIAEQLGFDPDQADNEEVTRTFMTKTFTEMEQLQASTQKGISELRSTTAEASQAIVAKDEAALAAAEKKIKALEENLKKVQESMYEDSLTRIYNRKWLNEIHLDNEKFRKNGVMASMDLNKFKPINDTYGHLMGDKVLQLIAALMRKLCGSVEGMYPCRYGGDEFLIFWDDASGLEKLRQELNRIRERLSAKPLETPKGSFTVGFSMGLASYKSGMSYEEAAEEADELMYADKERLGGGR